MDRKDGKMHYHIAVLDWECFSTRAKAEASAEQFVLQGETYSIVEHGEECPQCRAAMNQKSAHSA